MSPAALAAVGCSMTVGNDSSWLVKGGMAKSRIAWGPACTITFWAARPPLHGPLSGRFLRGETAAARRLIPSVDN